MGRMAQDVAERAGQGREHFQEFSAALAETTKAGGRVAVDTYEVAARSVLGLQRDLAGAAQVSWLREAATTQVRFAEDVTEAWTKAARALLK